MRIFEKRAMLLALTLLFCWQAAVASAAAPVNVLGVRCSTNAEKVRLVFDVDELPVYKVAVSDDGEQIQVDLSAVADKSQLAKLARLAVKDDTVNSVTFSQNGGNFRAIIALNQPAEYVVNQLKLPNRLFIDINKAYEKKISEEKAPGLVQTTYLRRDGRGLLTGYFVDVDPSRYKLRPALSNGVIAGRDTVSDMSDQNNAVAAINASYFALNGEILGLTKIDGKVVSTTYLPRSAFGILSDGSPLIGTVNYNGTVRTKTVALPIAGVNCERGENSVVLYNEYFASTTATNPYGREYVVKDNKVIAINPADSPLAAGTLVVSAHGTAKDALAGVKIGDRMEITEQVGDPWNNAQQVLGVGPRLLEGGSVAVTAEQEQFPADIAVGRAPRTAIGILPNQHVLLAVVDGRQKQSIGCTLTEMAELLKEFGAVNAVNFDGGGSSELVIGGRIINSPSDGSERNVGSALLVCNK